MTADGADTAMWFYPTGRRVARIFCPAAMTIRPATITDVPAVIPIVDKLAALHEKWDPVRYDYKPGTGDMYRKWLTARASDPSSVFLVADHERLLADVPFL